MPCVHEHTVTCPCCGESISILIDDSVSEQRYTEDCEVCCRPIVFDIAVLPHGDLAVVVTAENE
jgi:hypothetical protein